MTGSHNIKAGFQWGFGSYVNEFDINGDLVQRYRNGVADQVRIYNTPVRSEEFLNGDFGFYVQDSWTIDRLTVNAGLRGERFKGQISDQDVAAGRFVAARHFDKVECMPCWMDWAPRFGASYDLFGNARTALKGTINRYMAGQTLSYAQRYNPLRIQSDDTAPGRTPTETTSRRKPRSGRATTRHSGCRSCRAGLILTDWIANTTSRPASLFSTS